MSERDARVEAAAKALHKSFAEDEGYAAPVGVKEWEGMARAALAAADAVQSDEHREFIDGLTRALNRHGVPATPSWDEAIDWLAEHGGQPADDRRMVDLDAVLTYLRERFPSNTPSSQGEYVAKYVEREFDDPAPSEDQP